MSETNVSFQKKNGHGFGPVGMDDDQVRELNDLTIGQLDAILNLILLGDIEEVGWHKDTIGSWIQPIHQDDAESNHRISMAASLVYLSGRLAEEIPILKPTKQET